MSTNVTQKVFIRSGIMSYFHSRWGSTMAWSSKKFIWVWINNVEFVVSIMAHRQGFLRFQALTGLLTAWPKDGPADSIGPTLN